MNNIGLSLISQPFYTKGILERIKDLGFSHISVTPQQLGLLEPLSSPRLETVSIFEYSKSIGLDIHSIQGLFFGIYPGAKSLDLLLNDRLVKLAECAKYLSIPNLVLGSPDFRKSPDSWIALNKSLAEFEGYFLGGVHMENICTGSPSCDLSQNFPIDQSFFQVSRMLDVSNALSCSHVPSKSFVDLVESDFCHFSYKQHRIPHNQNEFMEMISLLDGFPQISGLIWEIFDSDLEESFKLLEKFNSYLL
jgi:hypothetical protein